MASALLAIQHLLVKKGVCTFTELSAANRRAQELIGALNQTIMADKAATGLIQHIKDVTEFIGGARAMDDIADALKKVEDLNPGGFTK